MNAYRMLWWLLFAGVAFVSMGKARAQLIGPTVGTANSIVYDAAGTVRVVDTGGSTVQAVGRDFTLPGGGGRGVGVTDTIRTPVGGKDLAISAARTASAKNIMTTAARVAGRALPAVAVGIELWDLWDENRIRPDGEGGVKHDEGADQVDYSAYCISGSGIPGGTMCAITPGQVCSQYAANRESVVTDTPQLTYTFTVQNVTETNCTLRTEVRECPTPNSCQTNFGTQGVNIGRQTAQKCPAATDPLNPANNIPEGAPPGPDGKCRTGRYSKPMTPEEAADWAEEHNPPSNEELEDIIRDLFERGESVPSNGPASVGGPSSQPGTTTTTTTQTVPPGGGAPQTITRTVSQTINYTYNDNRVTYNITTVTTTVNEDTGETTTETEGTPGEAEAQESDCAKNPDTVGCMKVGTPPTDKPEWEEKQIPFEAENLGFGGSCPPPYSFTLPSSGISMTVSYTPVCDMAPGIRAALLALTALGCILFILNAVRS